MLRTTSLNRRQFVKTSLGGFLSIGVGTAVPSFLAQAVGADASRTERILVVVQLTGGNDGLNMVVPYQDDAYYKARPKLGIPAADVLKQDDRIGFHPSLGGFHELMQSGSASVVQGVGYPNPNRSHFESMDIWHSCLRKDESRHDGWLGRYVDRNLKESNGDVPALHIGGRKQPFALAARDVRIPSLDKLSDFQLQGKNREAILAMLETPAPSEVTGTSDLLDFVQSSTTTALDASQRVTDAVSQYRPEQDYPDSELARKLGTVAQLIDSGLQTKVYYVELDGFDTHAEQAENHAILLRDWSEAVTAFMNDLSARDHAERVCVMTFSEFGRRVSENASAGTDHGAAGPMLLCGGKVRPGFLGEAPNLTDLENGDLRHQVDFRQVYAGVLQDWLDVNPSEIVLGNYAPLKLFA